MKGKVFIGWSGETTIADEVKNKLRESDFEGIVGGETVMDRTMYLGEAILKEIDSCNQAIFILQKKQDGTISASEMFELGYALSRLNANKIHVFYIDIAENDTSIPTDLKGIFASYMYNVDDTDIDERVIEAFMANQKKVFIGNKMMIINGYFERRRAFDMYRFKPFCSEYELAQHVLFFSQAAYMFNDIHEGQMCLQLLANRLTDINPELLQALSFAQGYLRIFANVKAKDDIIYLSNSPFIEARTTFKSVLKNISRWQDNEFKAWLEVLALESLNYIHILRAASPELSAERRENVYRQSLDYAFECLRKCEVLSGKPGSEISDQSDNEQCVSLYRAYMFRNLYTACLTLGRPEDAKAYLLQSFEERKKLLEYYKIRTISSRIYENIEMEYFLALSELLEYPEDSDSLDENIESCRDYLSKTKKLHLEKTHFISRIERNLKQAEEKL